MFAKKLHPPTKSAFAVGSKSVATDHVSILETSDEQQGCLELYLNY